MFRFASSIRARSSSDSLKAVCFIGAIAYDGNHHEALYRASLRARAKQLDCATVARSAEALRFRGTVVMVATAWELSRSAAV
jgi:hypothetical protein